MAERPDYALTTIVKKAKEEHRIDPTISYDFIKNWIQQVYYHPERIYENPKNEEKNFAVDISSRVSRITLEDAMIVTEEPKKYIWVYRKHELVPWVNAVDKSDWAIYPIERDWKKVCISRNGGLLQGDYEINGVNYNHRALEPLTSRLYLFATSAEFGYDSKDHVKHVVRDSNGRVNIMKDGDGTLSLENVVMTVDGVNLNLLLTREQNKKAVDSFAWMLSFILTSIICCTPTFIASHYFFKKDETGVGRFFAGLGIIWGVSSMVGVGVNYINFRLNRARSATGELDISFYGQVPTKSRDK